jgi:hypothetical protein
MPDAQDFSRSGNMQGLFGAVQGRVLLENVRLDCPLGRAVVTAPCPNFKRADHTHSVDILRKSTGAAPPGDNCNRGCEILAQEIALHAK